MTDQRESPWRWLDDAAGPSADEFPPGALEPPDSVDRRKFLALMSAPFLAASGCLQPPREEIIPYVRSPEGIVLGRPQFYATAMPLGGVATGLLVETHMARPTKIEGNPNHPASLGATDIFAQASILDLYDPDRSNGVVHNGRPSNWEHAVAAIRSALQALPGKDGAGLHVLSEHTTSPTLIAEMERLREQYPAMRWHRYEPFGSENIWRGSRTALKMDADVVYQLESSGVGLRKADVILSLDADFLNTGPGHLRYAREFAARRRVWNQSPSEASMPRLYFVGPTPCPTSATADHHLPMRAGDVGRFAAALAKRLGIAVGAATGADADLPNEWLNAVGTDLEQHAGRSLVVAGQAQPPLVHALALALNHRLRNIGQTVAVIPPVHPRPKTNEALSELVKAIGNRQVQVLLIAGANPVFCAPADFDLPRLLQAVPFRVHLGLYRDETAAHCQWHIPEAHFLESWGDARAFDGTASIIQPTIAPIRGGKTSLELLSALRGEPRSGYEMVRDHWRHEWQLEGRAFEERWRRSLHDGIIDGTTFTAKKIDWNENWWNEDKSRVGRDPIQGTEIVFRPDPTVHDGRFGNNGWLQELPKPLSKITWDNIVVIGVNTARELGLDLQTGDIGGVIETDIVEIVHRGRSIEAPVWIMPGHAEGSVTVYVGYGRSAAGEVGNGIGSNTYAVRSAEHSWFGDRVEIRKTGRRYQLACTQLHQRMHDRNIVYHGTLSEYARDPDAINRRHRKISLPIVDSTNRAAVKSPPPMKNWLYLERKWGMVIDLTVCNGCSACVVACQAENNIPVVGKKEVARGREMHWLRVDIYHTGNDLSKPENTFFQPVPCMHCEEAPCEVVCPVNATVHSDDGLNDMVYNRCVGTRYCSNNCPYKVRRFNFLSYADWRTEAMKPLRNPDVTVRSRGVMEKCTYCVQRINVARTHAEIADRPLVRNRAGTLLKPILPGELLTACQAVCPTGAIEFGDLNDPEAIVGRMRYEQPLNYGLLNDHLGTLPRTTYLSALRKPHPDLTRNGNAG